jgi:hypothetical protein
MAGFDNILMRPNTFLHAMEYLLHPDSMSAYLTQNCKDTVFQKHNLISLLVINSLHWMPHGQLTFGDEALLCTDSFSAWEHFTQCVRSATDCSNMWHVVLSIAWLYGTVRACSSCPLCSAHV